MGNSKHPYLTKEEFLKVTREIDIIRLWNSEAREMTSSCLGVFRTGRDLIGWCIDSVFFDPMMGTIQ